MGASLMMVGDNEVGVIGFVVSRHLLYPVFFPLTWSFLRPAPRAILREHGSVHSWRPWPVDGGYV